MSLIKAKDLDNFRVGGRLLASILAKVVAMVKPGVSIHELNDLAKREMIAGGGRPAFEGYGQAWGVPGYPAVLCVSVNDEVVHGIGSRADVLRDGDIVGLDIGVIYQAKNGLYTDMAVTVAVGRVSGEAQQLMAVTRQSLVEAIRFIKPGVATTDLSKAVQKYCEAYGYGVVKDLTGHGVGYQLHDEPTIPNFYSSNQPSSQLKAGMAICIEPMITVGGWQVKTDSDQWTVRTVDGSLAAHFEHTILITDKGFEVITLMPGEDI